MTATVDERLDIAIAHHQAGRLQQAEQGYRQILEADPTHADALHLLGLIHYQAGDWQAAIDRISRAVALKPNSAVIPSNLGAAYRAAGRLEEAVASCRRALDIKPHHLPAHNNLGLALKAQGKLDEAVAAYRQALQIEPGYAEAHLNLGAALAAQGKLEQAIASYRRAVELKPDYVQAYSNLGVALKDSGRLEEAVACYQRALQIEPDNAGAHNNLANALKDLGKKNEALASYRRALELNPDLADVHNNLANALKDLGRTDEAMTSYRRALEIKPDYAEAHNNLGNLLKDQGQLDEAAASYGRAVQLRPDYAEAYANLVQCRRYSDPDDPLIQRLQQLLANRSLAREDRLQIHFALGKIYNDCKNRREAFSHYQQANALAGVQFDVRSMTNTVDALIETCTRSLLERGAAIGNPSELPVLIVGMPRSGTSLVEQIVASHPAVVGAGELRHLAECVDTVRARHQGKVGYPACLAELDSVTAGELAGQYLAHLESYGADAVRVTDKMPANFMHLGLAALLLPNARVIHCRRHPLDVCLSCFFQKFTKREGLSFTFDLQSLGIYYKLYERLMEHWRQVLPCPLLEVNYEDLVARQEEVSRQLIEFCSLEWDPACLEFHKTERVVRTASSWEVRQPTYTSSVERWKQYEAFLEPLKTALGWSS